MVLHYRYTEKNDYVYINFSSNGLKKSPIKNICYEKDN